MHTAKEFVSAYLHYLEQLAHDGSKHTIANYKRDFLKFMTFLKSEMPNDNPLQFQSRYCNHYIIYLTEQGLGGRSIARHLSSMRFFYKWLIQKRVIDFNPFLNAKAPKFSKPLPNIPSVEQITKMLEDLKTIIANQQGWIAKRDMAIIECLYASGMRISELCDLTVADVLYKQGNDFSLDNIKNEIIVTGKGNKQRYVFFGEFAIDAIQHWLKVRNQLPFSEHQTALFLSKKHQAMTVRAVQHRLQSIGMQLELPMHLYPHLFRHAFASHLLASDVNIKVIQELMGHKSLLATQVYTQLDSEKLNQIYKAHHPLERED